MNASIDCLKAAIANDPSALLWAFHWSDSPEGMEYWMRQHGRQTISPAAKHRLRLMLRRKRYAEAKARSKLPKAVGLTEFLMGGNP